MALAQHETTWISTASALPACGQPVEFMLDARECPIVGVYSEDGFRSRWTHYAPEIVRQWRGAEAAPRTSVEKEDASAHC
jgi:hypothetical protein